MLKVSIKKYIMHFIVLIIIAVSVGIQSVDAKYTADFLTLGVGARALAMGGGRGLH